jgi:pSer/pThr/pTyr-binding forkhead associated (FHA) protein
MPYLRIFDPVEGSRELDLRKTRVVIGRQPNVDLLLNHPSVSRLHALLLKSGDGYLLNDYNSLSGTLVNNNRVLQHTLAHGDCIQIGLYVLEYRTDDAERQASLTSSTDSAIMRQIRMSFRLLPAGIQAKWRAIAIAPDSIFSTGDTLHVGDGGILLLTKHPLPENSCLEMELTWPNGKTKTLMGEVKAVLEGGEVPGMCVKLHSIETQLHLDVIREAKRGSWLAPEKTKKKNEA